MDSDVCACVRVSFPPSVLIIIRRGVSWPPYRSLVIVVLVVVVWIVVAFGMSGLDHFRVAMSPEQKQRTANPLVLLASISFLPLPSPRLLFLCTEEGSI